MQTTRAARNTVVLWEKTSSGPLPGPKQADDGMDLHHVRYVLNEVEYGRITGEKAHRWLGWAQGYLMSQGLLTLDDCKYANVLA
jgi:hypothetical protein